MRNYSSRNMIFWIWLSTFLTVSVHAVVKQACFECPEVQEITPKFPINTSEIYTFPTRAFTQFPANYACSWIINIPSNYTVIVQLKATIPEGGHVSITQVPLLNQTEKFVEDMEVTRFFVPPSFDIFWYPGSSRDGNFKFSLQFQYSVLN
uniref:CUB_2 domain-containing protein n=2 Tax=Caenorhabditis japonica TaxID=281687 RepID=A0A8R1EF87_CAEJA